jgi:predicted dehydrogenase
MKSSRSLAMGTKVKVGIIGLGFMGTTHFNIHKELGKSEIVAVADVDIRKLRGDWSSVVGNIGDSDYSKPVDMSKIETYIDAMDLIANKEVEMVDICVPTYLHEKFVIAALKKGKHVFSEKPIGRTIHEAKRITEEAEISDKYFMNGLCVRYWPEYRHAWELYKSGELGKVISAAFKRVSPSSHDNSWQDWFMNADLSGGALLDLHLHDTDLVRYFFGRPVSVTSFGTGNFRSANGIDHVFTNYNFENKNLIMAEGGWDPAKNTPFEMSFQIVCEKGTIRLSELDYQVIYEDGSVHHPKPAIENLPTGWHVEIDYFLSSILAGTVPDKYLNTTEMCDSIAIIEAEEKSINERRTVKVEY